tara:strand:- start:5207 stop:6259 length:1053 start_codon:yes stop_codon:yes gene_type:complete
MKLLLLSFAYLLAPILSVFGGHHEILDLPGKKGPGKGKTIVLVSGDEEYRTEESMPMLAKILSQKHGFDCKVLFAWDSAGKHIDPNNQAGVRGWEHLKSADLMLIGTRFRKPTAEQAKHVTEFLNAGKPIIGIRTSTHAFNGSGKFGDKISYGAFGPLVMGEGWVNHHGRHKVEGARGVVEAKNAKHPILNGVKDVFGPSDVYGIRRLTDKDTILMRGAVTATLDPKSKLVEGKNEPMQPLAWLHPYEAPNGKGGTTFCTTMGASVDLVSEDLRRLLVNAAYHLTGLKVPQNADASYVDPFYPSFYGFIRDKNHWPSLDMQPSDYGLGKSPTAPEPKGSPKWPWRDSPKN